MEDPVEAVNFFAKYTQPTICQAYFPGNEDHRVLSIVYILVFCACNCLPGSQLIELTHVHVQLASPTYTYTPPAMPAESTPINAQLTNKDKKIHPQ